MITIVNLMNTGYQVIEETDVVSVRVDRTSPLGNPFPMKNYSQEERNRVCDLYSEWFWERVGMEDERIMHILETLVEAAKEKIDIALYCWCAPLRCHAETIKHYIEREASK